MKFKKVLSDVLAGILAISSSFAAVSPTAFAADDITWDLPMLAAEASAQTVIDSQRVNGWNSFDVDLRSYGIMNQFTTVTITCVTEATEIVGEDGKTPEAAFGVVINGNMDQATMPCCGYNPSETVFEMTLTAEQLENNPVFKVQSQLPVAAIFTVTVSNLTEDNRKALSLAPLSENVTVNTYDASSWMNGGNCFGSVSIPAEKISCDYAITYGETTVSELRTNVKFISTSAIPYYGDSLDAGADAFAYNVAIVCGNGVVVSTMSSEDSFDLTSPGTTYIDDLCTNELDSFVVYEIIIEISAKLFWNDEISKNQAVSDKIRLAKPDTHIQLEIVEDTRIALPLPAIDKYSMVLTAKEGQDWLIGSYAYADYIVPDPVGKTYGNTTIGALRSVLKRFNTTANTYVSDSLNAGEDSFEYCIDIEAKNGEDYIRFSNGSFRLTESGAVYVDNFDCDGTKMSSDTYDDYVITAIIIKVQSALGLDPETQKSYALCEDIRNMNPGDTLTLNLKEDTREDVKTEVTDTSVNMGVRTDSWLDGVNATGCTSTLTIPGITYGTTRFEDIKKTIRSLNVTVPYFSDTIGADKDAFVYKFVIEFADGNTWWGGDYADLGTSLTQLIDDIDVSEFADTTIARVFISIEAELEDTGEGKQRAVSEVIRAQKEDTSFTIDLVQKNTKPQNVKATAGDSKITITWDAVAGAEKYGLYLYENGALTTVSSVLTKTTYTLNNCVNGKTYGLLVRAYKNGVLSEYTASDVVYATPKPAKAGLTGIKVVTAPTKTKYKVGESIDVTGGKVTLIYEGSKTEEISLTEDMLTYDNSKAGKATVTVKYDKFEDTFEVEFEKVTVDPTEPTDDPTNPTNPTTPTSTNPVIGGSSKSWSDVAADLGKLTSDSEATIQLNGSTSVPVDVIKTIADKGSKVTLTVDSVYSWVVDGSKITTPAAADLTITKTASTKSDSLRGIEGTQFKINNTNIPTNLEIAFKSSHAGRFANLYKNVDGKLTFVTCAKLGEDGKAILPDVTEKGDYVAMLCEFSDRLGDMDNDGIMNTKDSLAILKDFLGIESGTNPLVSDVNNDGFINSKDALVILKKFLGLA